MHILSIGKILSHNGLDIVSIEEISLQTQLDINVFDYIIIHGGDGTIRRVLQKLYTHETLPPLIFNPTGSFNVIAKLHQVESIEKILNHLANGKTPNIKIQQLYRLNNEIFLFSAGNMVDLQHIFFSETLRFGFLKKGMTKYILAFLFLFPVYFFVTPFMLMSKRKFFIFTPLPFIKKFGSFYGEVKEMTIDLENNYNFIELDGDVVLILERFLHIKIIRSIQIVSI